MTYLRNILIILKQANTYKWRLAVDYCKLLTIAFIQHRTNVKKMFHTSFLGLKIEFIQLNTFINLIDEIFIHECYRTTSNKEFIVDIGGHIGLSAIYFNLNHPKAVIHVYEVNPITFKLLEKNIANNNLHNIYCFNKGVSVHNESLFLHAGKTDLNTFLSSEKSDISIPCISILNIVSSTIDLLKIDTEGTEAALLTHLIASDSLSHIQEIVVETVKNDPLIASLKNKGLEINTHTHFNYNVTEDVILFKRK